MSNGGHLVVGYTPGTGGADAVALAGTLARGRNVGIDLVVVVPEDEPTYARYSPDKAFHGELVRQAREWLAEAEVQVPAGLAVCSHVVAADSTAEGLIGTAERLGAIGIVVGAARSGLLRRVTVGSDANALLHASPVPVALAPRGYQAPPRITRLTCAVGTRPGKDALVDVAVAAAAARGVPLRLISLVALGGDHAGSVERAEAHAAELVEQVGARLPEGLEISARVGRGEDLEDAVRDLDFLPDEFVLLGSSRLAQHRRLFLGVAASKILRSLPVPMVVVPRDHSAGDGP